MLFGFCRVECFGSAAGGRAHIVPLIWSTDDGQQLYLSLVQLWNVQASHVLFCAQLHYRTIHCAVFLPPVAMPPANICVCSETGNGVLLYGEGFW